MVTRCLWCREPERIAAWCMRYGYEPPPPCWVAVEAVRADETVGWVLLYSYGDGVAGAHLYAIPGKVRALLGTERVIFALAELLGVSRLLTSGVTPLGARALVRLGCHDLGSGTVEIALPYRG